MIHYTITPAFIIHDLDTLDERFFYLFCPNGTSARPFNWPTHETDLRSVSKAHPDTIITLHMQDENGYQQQSYFLNGKVHRAEAKVKVQFEAFNPEKLEEIKK